MVFVMLIIVFCLNSNESKQVKQKNYRAKVIEIMVPLKYLSTFMRTLEMPLTNCEINFILCWPANCFIMVNANCGQIQTIAITDPKLYVPVVILSTQALIYNTNRNNM